MAPIGNNSLFADQFQIVSSLKSIPFYELNRPLTSKASPFKFLNWKDGELLFEYLRYDRSSAGPGDLDDFQVSQYPVKITAVEQHFLCRVRKRFGW